MKKKIIATSILLVLLGIIVAVFLMKKTDNPSYHLKDYYVVDFKGTIFKSKIVIDRNTTVEQVLLKISSIDNKIYHHASLEGVNLEGSYIIFKDVQLKVW